MRKEGLGKEEIISRVQQDRKVIWYLNMICWDEHVSNKRIIAIRRATVDMCYVAGVWSALLT